MHPLLADVDGETLRAQLKKIDPPECSDFPNSEEATLVTRSIADELEIRSLVHRYTQTPLPAVLPPQSASTFTDDGEWHAPELGVRKGRDAMIAFFTSMLDGWNVFLQGLQSGVMVVNAADADHATGRWFVQEVGQRAEGTNLTIAGVYHDEYRREAGVWLIMRRRYDPLLQAPTAP